MPAATLSPSGKALKTNAESCMKQERYSEAFFHLTHAIKLNPDPALVTPLMALRSKAFCKAGQYHFALKDAKEVQNHCPEDHIGYCREAEALQEVSLFESAADAYMAAFRRAGEFKVKEEYHELARKCRREALRNALFIEATVDRQQPWVGAAMGIVISVLGVVYDAIILRQDSWLQNPLLKVVVIILGAALGYFLAKLYRSQLINSKKYLIDPPPDIFEESKKTQ